MKYQVYLNKDTSKIIGLVAKMEGVKPNTLIKQLVEGLLSRARAFADNEKDLGGLINGRKK